LQNCNAGPLCELIFCAKELLMRFLCGENRWSKFSAKQSKLDDGFREMRGSAREAKSAAQFGSNSGLPTMLEVIWARPSHVTHLMRTMASAAFYNAAKQ
jgi:hypothetical protein